jgi:formyl-CoA transferase/CoA:oxalate CoA-transferase
MSNAPLEGIAVVDFSQALAGPISTTLLADLGADVVVVEPPGGVSSREFMGVSNVVNMLRNKRSIGIDLKSDEGTEIARELVASADVLVHNFSPGTMEKLGFGYETVIEYNEQIVYCSITGFGETGPFRDWSGFDQTVQAMSGIMSLTGEPDRKPSRVGVSAIDAGTGILAALGILVVLWNREQTGDGQKVTGSLLDTAGLFTRLHYTRYSVTDEVPQRMGHTMEGYQPMGHFETATDPIYVSAGTQRLWEGFCKVLDRPDWAANPKFETPEDRVEHMDVLHEAIEEEFQTYEFDDLIERLATNGIPAGPVNDIPAAVEDMRRAGAIRKAEDENGETVLTNSPPLTFSKSEHEPVDSPVYGEHTREILRELGYADDEVSRVVEDEIVYDDGG